MRIVYLNDRFLPEEEATIPITDRGFLFGDGLFTTIRIQNGEPIWLEEHLAKLNAHAHTFNLTPPPFDQSVIPELIKKNGFLDARLKVLYTGGDSQELALPQRKGRLLLTIAPLGPPPKVIRATTCTLPSFPAKTLSYLSRLWAKEQAYPFDDCVTLNEKGEVLETAFGNIFWKVGEQLYTPDPALGIYWGVTIAKQDVEFVRMRLSEIPKEATFFRTNATTGVVKLVLSAEDRVCASDRSSRASTTP